MQRNMTRMGRISRISRMQSTRVKALRSTRGINLTMAPDTKLESHRPKVGVEMPLDSGT